MTVRPVTRTEHTTNRADGNNGNADPSVTCVTIPFGVAFVRVTRPSPRVVSRGGAESAENGDFTERDDSIEVGQIPGSDGAWWRGRITSRHTRAVGHRPEEKELQPAAREERCVAHAHVHRHEVAAIGQPGDASAAADTGPARLRAGEDGREVSLERSAGGQGVAGRIPARHKKHGSAHRGRFGYEPRGFGTRAEVDGARGGERAGDQRRGERQQRERGDERCASTRPRR